MERFSLVRAWVWILGITLVVSGGSWAFVHWLQKLRQERLLGPHYQIVALALQAEQRDHLEPAYFAELLHLSSDCPTNIHRFDLAKAEEALLAFPVIKEIRLQKVLPGTLYISYRLRQPIFYLANILNTGVGVDGILFPCHPFIRPKKAPYLFLDPNEGDFELGKPLSKRKGWKLAVEVLDIFSWIRDEKWGELRWIDVSQIEASSLGRRELIMMFELNDRRFYVRLPTAIDPSCVKRLYWVLDQWIPQSALPKETPLLIDLRLSQLAFLRPITEEQIWLPIHL